ncbi:MAG: hypothetical protein AB7N76_35030 [Planctomycetota bacterium]
MSRNDSGRPLASPKDRPRRDYGANSSTDLRQRIARFNTSADLLTLLGGEAFQRRASTNGGEWAGPCPLCGGEDRCRVWPAHERGPRAWCRGCGTSGDPLTWALCLDGVDPSERGATTRWLRDRAELIQAAPVRPRPRKLQGRAAPRVAREELAALWGACLPVVEVREAREFLDHRQLDAGAVEDLDLARALPRGGALPRWACSKGRTWREAGYWLVAPMLDHRGQLANLHARSCRVPAPEPKSLNPRGGSPRGAVFADPLAARLLAGEPEARQQVRKVGLVVVEGLPDFLRAATLQGSGAGPVRARAVLGLLVGSWTVELAARMPSGTDVCVVPHVDPSEAGGRLMAPVVDALRERCAVARLDLSRGGP